MMQRLFRLVAVAVAMIGLGNGATIAADRPAKPNVIFILVDDLGYGDLGAFFQNQRKADAKPGEPAHFTPHLDALADGGMKLTHHYCPAPVCAPSRASLLLGVNQGHCNVRDNQFDKLLEDNHTLATVMKQAGYATFAVGKWGLQGGTDKDAPNWPSHPMNRGFDHYFGYIRHRDGHEHYPKEGIHRGAKEVYEDRTNVAEQLDKCYTTDLFAARAKKYIADHHAAKPDQPFFMYLAYDTPHAVLSIPTQAYPQGAGAKGGLQWTGKPGQMINTASGKPDSYMHPDYANATWDHDKNPATPEVAWPDVQQRYATCVRRIDDTIGDLMALLKDLKLDQNTLVVFSSDNGPSVESYLKEEYEPTFFNSFGPFDGIKRDTWEGGVRVPTIANWPAAIKPGGLSTLPSSFPDWMPTFAEAAGLPAPAKTTGVSLLPTLTGAGDQQTPTVYIEYFVQGKTPGFDEFLPAHRGRQRKQMQTLRIGNHVGVRYDIKSADDDFEIYDAVADPQQSKDLGKQTDFADLQQQFKARAMQSRVPGGDVKRPYDDAAVPPMKAMPAGKARAGIAWQRFDGPFPWTPKFDGMKPQSAGVAKVPDLSAMPKDQPFGVFYTGLLAVPADGEYTFTVTSDSGIVLRLHDMTVIDADRNHQPGQPASGKVRLKAGQHPIRIYYAHRSKVDASLSVDWTPPGGKSQPIPASAFSHVAGQPGDPQADRAAPPVERAPLPPVQAVRELQGQERSDAINARDDADRLRAAYEKAHRAGAVAAGDRAKADADFAPVVAAYRLVIDQYPATEFESGCRLRLAGAYQFRGQFDAALKEARQAAERFAGTTHGLAALQTVGLIHLQAMHEPEKAAVYFRQLQAAAASLDDEQEQAKWQVAAAQGLARCQAK